jgi:tRNA (mo5U34)-methyltransferase
MQKSIAIPMREIEKDCCAKLFDREALFTQLQRRGLADWAEQLRAICAERLGGARHGLLPKWIEAWQQLPDVSDPQLEATENAITVSGISRSTSHDSLRQILMQFHPWRKGPFEFLGLPIDTEWRSDLKWNRLAKVIDFRHKAILDIGCGNGYYGWKMLAAGADFVLGCDPFLLYVMQFEIFRRYASLPERLFVVPLADTELPAELQAFDMTISMGVLYHRTSPVDHLQLLLRTLKPGGQLVLETLVIDSTIPEVLVPEDRYAKMRNVWFIPSIPMLLRWLTRVGFRDLQVIDVSATTSAEQRRTDWMTFESLADFLDPADPTRTLEGYPAPTRAMLTARR